MGLHMYQATQFIWEFMHGHTDHMGYIRMYVHSHTDIVGLPTYVEGHTDPMGYICMYTATQI